MKQDIPSRANLDAYLESGKPQVCELAAQPYLCEFWPQTDLDRYNREYEVELYAPGYFGFATSGGGEMYAVSPQGEVVCLPFVGMSPHEERVMASSWSEFEAMLRSAL
jgi:hypothetical protein